LINDQPLLDEPSARHNETHTRNFTVNTHSWFCEVCE